MAPTASLAELERLPISALEEKLAAVNDPAERLALLTALGWLQAPNDVAQSEGYTLQARELAANLGAETYAAHLRRNDAYALLYRSQYGPAMVAIDQAQALYDDMDDPDAHRLLNLMRAMIYFHMSDYPNAQTLAETTLADAEAAEDTRLVSTALALLGSIATLTQQYELAEMCFKRTIPIYKARGYPRGLGKVHNNLGQVYREMGRFEDALAAAEQGLNYYREAQNQRGEMYINNLLGGVYSQMGQLTIAANHHRAALAIAQSINDRASIVRDRHELAYVAQLQGDYAAAIEGYLAVIPIAEATSQTHGLCSTHRELVTCYEALGDYPAALHHMRRYHELQVQLTKAEVDNQLAQSQYKLQVEMTRKEAEIQRLKAEEARLQLQHADRLTAVGKMAASIAHEINNPLQVIYGNLLLLAEAYNDTAHTPALSSTIEHIQRIIKLVASMREMYQFNVVEPQPLDLSEIVEKVLFLTRKSLEKQGVKLVLALAADLPTLHASPTQMQQVILNLILNAQDAMPDGGTLTLKTRATDAHLLLEISDTGQGITPEQLRHIFDPFFTTRADGSGLGLTICQQIVQHYDGHLSISSATGQGTSVRVQFPR